MKVGADAARRREYARAYYWANRDKCRTYGRKYYAANAKKVCARASEWQRANPERRRAYRRRWRYGTDGAAMLAAQGNVCAICKRPFDESGRGPRSKHLDHDHATGVVRGWLCKGCNVGIGHFAENQDWLRNAIEYLTRHNKATA